MFSPLPGGRAEHTRSIQTCGFLYSPRDLRVGTEAHNIKRREEAKNQATDSLDQFQKGTGGRGMGGHSKSVTLKL